VVRVEGGLNWVTAAWNIAGQESLRGTNLVIHNWWFICVEAVWVHSVEMYDRCISQGLFNARVFRKSSQVCSVSVSYIVLVHVIEWKTWVVLIFVFELKYSSIIKNLFSLPFVLLYLCFWYLFAMIIFLAREQIVLQMGL